jgi:ketosteroid isomerase-like protein
MLVKTQNEATLTAVDHFNQAFFSQDIEAVMAAITDDCVFENTYPAPDGTRYEGKEAVGAAFAEFFRSSPQAQFTIEDIVALGDRCVVRWLYRWQDEDGRVGHVRGIDLFRVRARLVAEKLSYVKG